MIVIVMFSIYVTILEIFAVHFVENALLHADVYFNAHPIASLILRYLKE